MGQQLFPSLTPLVFNLKFHLCHRCCLTDRVFPMFSIMSRGLEPGGGGVSMEALRGSGGEGRGRVGAGQEKARRTQGR